MNNFICKKCGSNEYEIKDKPNGTGIAHGLYCAKCGFWHKWLGKEELKLYDKKENKDEVIALLQAENAELKARLEKAVELPCQYGDEIYSILNFGKESIVLKGKCERVMYEKSASVSRTTVWGVFEDEWQLHPYTFTNESLKFIFKTRKEAEAQLEELKGENE